MYVEKSEKNFGMTKCIIQMNSAKFLIMTVFNSVAQV